MGNSFKTTIITITDFIDYIENNDIDTSLLSEWSPRKRQATRWFY